MADAIAVGIKLTNDSADFEAHTAASEKAWGRLSGALGSISSTTASVTQQFAKLGLSAPEALGSVGKAAEGAVAGFTQAQNALTSLAGTAPRLASLAFGPVGIAIAAAAAVGFAAWAAFKDDTFELFGEVAGESVTLSEAVGAAWSVTKDLAGDALKAVGGYAKDAFTAVKGWFDRMPEGTADAFEYVWDGAKTVFSKIGDAGKLLFELLVGVAGAGVKGMVAALPALWEAYKNAFTQIGKLAAAAWDALKTGSTEPLTAQLRESGRSMVDALGDVGKAGSKAFVDNLPPAFAQLKDMAGAAFADLRKRWADAVVDGRDGKSTDSPAVQAAARAAEELVRQQQALQDTLTNLTRAGIEARRALESDALDRELRELQGNFQLRKISEQEYIEQSAVLQQRKLQETIDALTGERDAVAANVDRLVQQWVKLDTAGDTAGALKTQTAIANALKTQTELTTKLTVSTRALTDIDTERANRLEAMIQKQRDADAAALDAVDRYREKLTEGRQQREFELGLIGKTTEQQQVLRATQAASVELQRIMNDLKRVETQITRELLRKEGARPDVLRDLYRQQNVLFQQAADQRTEISQAETDARDRINAESADKFEKGLADALTNGLMSGRGVANSLRDYFKQVLGNGLRQILTQALSGVGGSLSQILGGSGGAGGGILSGLFGGGGGSGGGGFLSSLLGGAGNLFNSAFGMNLSAGFSGFFGGASQLISGTLGGMSELGLGFTEAASGAIEALGGMTSALGAAIPVIGLLIAGLLASGVLDRKPGFKLDNSVVGVGNSPDHFTQGALGNFDVSTPGDQSPFNPLRSGIVALDAEVATLFGPAQLAAVRQNIQNLQNATHWENLDASGIEAATLRFLKQRDSTAFDIIDTEVADMIRAFAGTSDQLMAFVKAAVAAEKTVAALKEAVPGIEVTAAALLSATDDQRNALTALAQTFQLTTSNYVQAANDAIEASKRTLSEALVAQNAKVADLARSLDGSLASAQALAAAEAQRIQMIAALIQQIAQASSEISNMFTASAEQFRLATMNPSEQYLYYDQKAADTFALLKEATDPQRIRELAAQYNQLLTSSFALLTPEQRAAKGGEFATLADQANAVAQERLAAAQAAAEAEARQMSTAVEAAITTAMNLVVADMKTNNTAFATAVDKFDKAVNTPMTIHGYLDTTDGRTVPLDVQAGSLR